ncbi:MAG: ABC transporter substrate-binding protein [Bacteroidetes bacterium]|nr:ABC transporter substrate-binding protein [Bacteroidota bacterium]
MRRYISLFLSVILIASLSSCDSNSDDEEQQLTEISIGLAVPLTGSLAITGQDMRLAAEMSVSIVNEDTTSKISSVLRLSIADTKSTADGTKEAFEELIENNIRYIIGPYTSANTDEIIPIIDEAGVVTIAPASAADGLSEKSQWLFRSALTVDRLIPITVKRTHDLLDYEYIASLTNQADLFSRNATTMFLEEVTKITGVRYDIKETFARFPDDVLPQMDSQIRSLLNPLQPLDAIFFFGLAPDRLNFILRAHQLGLRNIPLVIPVLSTSDIRRAREVIPESTDGIYATQVWVSSSAHPTSRNFVEAFQERYSVIPNDFHARTYASMSLLLKAIEESEVPTPTSEEVRAQLADFRNVDTIYGPFSFDANGDAIYDPVVGIVNGNNIDLIPN